MPRQRLVGLDILRVLAALAVMAFHFCFRGEQAGNYLPILDLPLLVKTAASYGYLGVHVFFIISGFVIAYSAENATPSQFLVARFSRIYPTFVMVMTLTTVISVLSGNPIFAVSPQQYAANLIILAPVFGKPFVDGAYWSIVLEIFFYFWVFLIVSMRQFSKILPICLLWIVCSFSNEYFIHSRPIHDVFITEYSGFFALGIAIYSLRQSYSFQGVSLFVIASAYALFTATAHADQFALTYATDLSKSILTGCLITSVLLFIQLLKVKGEGRFWRVVGMLGGATYSQYLSHQNIGYIAIGVMLPHMPAAPAVILVSAALIAGSVLFHILIENKLRSVAKRLLLQAPVSFPNRN